MKTIQLFCYFLLTAILLSCSDDDVESTQELIADDLGTNFRQVDYNYSDHQDGIRYVNATTGVKIINDAPNGIKGQHWVYKSPSLQGQEIGFSVVYSSACEGTPCDVILFLHGSEGSENSGSTLFYDYYIENEADKPRAFIFANGIYAPESPIESGVWKSRSLNDLTFNHPQQLVELIGGIVDDPELFPFMKTDMNNWSVTGFSAGGSGVMGAYMDPAFDSHKQYQPKHFFPLGGWMTDSLGKYYDFDGGLTLLESCDNSDLELIIANHIEDDVDCKGAKQFQSKDYLVGNFTAKDVPFTFLGLTDEGLACEQGTDHNPVHSVKFYLRNTIDGAIKNVNCGDTTYLEAYEVLGDLLYRTY
ncbi:MAG: hypothetical protein AB3N14_19520 [Flavobacteriaceae bacterium]